MKKNSFGFLVGLFILISLSLHSQESTTTEVTQNDVLLKAKIIGRANVRKEPMVIGTDIIMYLDTGSMVEIIDYPTPGGYWKVRINGVVGYMVDVFFIKTPEFNKLKEVADSLDNERRKKLEEERIAYEKKWKEEGEKERNSKLERIKRKYGLKNYQKIIDKQIWIGMNEEMAILSWGEPDEKNNTVGSWGVHSQWVYRSEDTFLYFENGKLVSFQD
jgi:hypothetical protein